MDSFNLPNFIEDKINTIFILTTRWGAHFGGINVFNYEMCITLGKVYKDKQIFCFVLEHVDSEIEDAKQNNIELVSFPDYRYLDIINFSKEKKINPDIIIGHDMFTGGIANKCRDKIKNTISAVIFHHTYHFYAALKGKTGEETDSRELQQKVILKEADIVFTVGPKLLNSLKDYRIDDAIELNPGCFKTNIKIFTEDNLGNTGTRIMGSGRLSKEDNHIKQSELLKNAFIEYSNDKSGDHILCLLGLTKDEIMSLCKNNCEEGNNIIAKEFTNNREEIFDIISIQSLFVMPSRHEGFGLTGLEAITMGVPLIVTTNSGLYEQLSKHTEIKDWYIPLDVVKDDHINKTKLLEALNEFNSKKSEYKKKALDLRDYFNQNITWELLVKKIIDKSKERINIKPIFPIKNETEIDQFIQRLKTNDNSLEFLESECSEILESKNLKKELHFGKILRGMVSISKTNIDIEEALTEQYEESKYILLDNLTHDIEDFLEECIVSINSSIEELSIHDKYVPDYINEGLEFEEVENFLEDAITNLCQEIRNQEELSGQIGTHEEQDLGQLGYDLEDFNEYFLDDIRDTLQNFKSLQDKIISKKEFFEANEKIYNQINDLDDWYKEELQNKLIDNPFEEYLNTKKNSIDNKESIYSKFCLKVWEVIKY